MRRPRHCTLNRQHQLSNLLGGDATRIWEPSSIRARLLKGSLEQELESRTTTAPLVWYRSPLDKTAKILDFHSDLSP